MWVWFLAPPPTASIYADKQAPECSEVRFRRVPVEQVSVAGWRTEGGGWIGENQESEGFRKVLLDKVPEGSVKELCIYWLPGGLMVVVGKHFAFLLVVV